MHLRDLLKAKQISIGELRERLGSTVKSGKPFVVTNHEMPKAVLVPVAVLEGLVKELETTGLPYTSPPPSRAARPTPAGKAFEFGGRTMVPIPKDDGDDRDDGFNRPGAGRW